MSVKETSVCVVDNSGKIVREVKVASEPKALLAVLKNPAYRFERIGLEAGPLSQWLYSAVAGDADQKGQVAVRLVDLRLRQLISLNRRRIRHSDGRLLRILNRLNFVELQNARKGGCLSKGGSKLANDTQAAVLDGSDPRASDWACDADQNRDLLTRWQSGI